MRSERDRARQLQDELTAARTTIALLKHELWKHGLPIPAIEAPTTASERRHMTDADRDAALATLCDQIGNGKPL